MNQPAAGSLEMSITAAIAGDATALEDIVRLLQPGIYGLAIRMLWNREDAEDATQEILIRIVTRLAQFDFRSQLKTWAYRVAVNYLLDVKKSPTERLRLSFESFSEDLADGLSRDGPSETERSVLVEEVKIGCTIALLQCLDRPHRAAYIVGEILELSGPEAQQVLEISPELFRKRRQRWWSVLSAALLHRSYLAAKLENLFQNDGVVDLARCRATGRNTSRREAAIG